MSFSKKGKWYPRKDSYIPSIARAGMAKSARRKKALRAITPVSDEPNPRLEFNLYKRKIKQRLERLELMLQMKRDGVL